MTLIPKTHSKEVAKIVPAEARYSNRIDAKSEVRSRHQSDSGFGSTSRDRTSLITHVAQDSARKRQLSESKTKTSEVKKHKTTRNEKEDRGNDVKHQQVSSKHRESKDSRRSEIRKENRGSKNGEKIDHNGMLIKECYVRIVKLNLPKSSSCIGAKLYKKNKIIKWQFLKKRRSPSSSSSVELPLRRKRRHTKHLPTSPSSEDGSDKSVSLLSERPMDLEAVAAPSNVMNDQWDDPSANPDPDNDSEYLFEVSLILFREPKTCFEYFTFCWSVFVCYFLSLLKHLSFTIFLLLLLTQFGHESGSFLSSVKCIKLRATSLFKEQFVNILYQWIS